MPFIPNQDDELSHIKNKFKAKLSNYKVKVIHSAYNITPNTF